MNKKTLLVLGLCVLLACSCFMSGCGKNNAAGKIYPANSVKVICHQSAGGSVDTTARLLADFAAKKLGQAFVTENVTGAGGRAANVQVFTSTPDGYTLGTENILTLLIGQAAFEGQYDSQKFAHIFGYIETGHVLVVKEDSPIQTMDDIVSKLKEGRTTIGTFGKGSSSHLQMILIAQALGVTGNAAYVHFEGTSPQLTALLGDNCDFAITGYGAYAKTDGLRAIAVADNVRDAFMPDVPTLAECNVDSKIVTQIWGFMAPPETPDEIVKTLAETFAEGVQDQAVIDGFNKIKLTPISLDTVTYGQKIAEQAKLVEENLDMLLN